MFKFCWITKSQLEVLHQQLQSLLPQHHIQCPHTPLIRISVPAWPWRSRKASRHRDRPHSKKCCFSRRRSSQPGHGSSEDRHGPDSGFPCACGRCQGRSWDLPCGDWTADWWHDAFLRLPCITSPGACLWDPCGSNALVEFRTWFAPVRKLTKLRPVLLCSYKDLAGTLFPFVVCINSK